MKNHYGEGYYIEGKKIYKGQIVINEFKLFLENSQGSLTDTYIPLEKIERIRKTRRGLEIKVKLSVTNNYTVLLKGRKQKLSEMLNYIVKRLNMKKRFLKNEWIGEISWK